MFVIVSGWTAADRNQASSLTLFLEVEHLFFIMLFVIVDVMRISKRVLLLINAKLIQLIVRLTRPSPTAGYNNDCVISSKDTEQVMLH